MQNFRKTASQISLEMLTVCDSWPCEWHSKHQLINLRYVYPIPLAKSFSLRMRTWQNGFFDRTNNSAIWTLKPICAGRSRGRGEEIIWSIEMWASFGCNDRPSVISSRIKHFRECFCPIFHLNSNFGNAFGSMLADFDLRITASLWLSS